MSLEDYDIISILGDSISSASYKVRSKTTNKTLVLQTLDYSNVSDSEKNKLFKRVQKRINFKHPNVLLVYDYIEQKDNKILYLVVEYCANGSLRKLVEYCAENKFLLHEEFVCKILYQIVFALKTVEEFVGAINLDRVFFDEDYNVKLYNYNFGGQKIKPKDGKMCNVLGVLMFEMCTLKKFDKQIVDVELKDLTATYSGGLISLLHHMIKDTCDIKKNIDKILCHPTLLMKSTKWTKEKCFINLKSTNRPECINEYEDPDEIRMEALRKKEDALNIREKKLMERELKLLNREKKLQIMERTLTEKLMNLKKLSNKDNLDSTYVECDEDSTILPTSKKLDVHAIKKPPTFTRTLSERRIRFKGHSPLKEIDINRRKHPRKKELKEKSECSSSDWKTCSENDSEISSLDGKKTGSRQLFVDGNVVEENEYDIPPDCRPIAWNSQNKKYAFEMLRIMNGGGDKENNINNRGKEIRHTVL